MFFGLSYEKKLIDPALPKKHPRSEAPLSPKTAPLELELQQVPESTEPA